VFYAHTVDDVTGKNWKRQEPIVVQRVELIFIVVLRVGTLVGNREVYGGNFIKRNTKVYDGPNCHISPKSTELFSIQVR